MDLEFKYGQTVLDMKAIGKIIRLAARVNFGMWTVMSSMGNGRMTRPMVMVFTCI